ncbi:MAG: hypothetical protein IJH77_04635, partial [Mogibacterium sp.]|nr:hypothetical protein [Mogibacterium sp.]
MKYLYQEGFTQNREISWLRFNERVLEEAADLSVPPLERLRFIAICQSNLEEFYRVRVGSLMAQKASGDTTPDIRSGWTPSRQLEEISRELAPVLRRRDLLYTQTIEALAASGIRHARAEDLTREERRRFARQLLQGPERLKPVILHGFRELPEPETGKVCQISLLPSDSGLYIGFLPVPEVLPSYYVLESGEEGVRIIQTAELLRAVVSELYVPFEPSASCLIRIERSAEFPDVDEDDLPADSKLRMKTLLKGRAAQHAVLLETDLPLPDMAAEALSDRFGIPEEQITCAGSLLGLDYAYALEKDLPEGIRKQVCFRPHQPRNRYPETDGRMMDLVRRRDLLLSFPYDSFEPLIRLLEEAAEDPQAREIR